MEVKTRLFDLDKDYELISNWWNERKQTIIPKEFLNQYGVMAFVDNKPIGVMWLFPVLGCNWSIIRFPITNIESTIEQRDLAMDAIFDNLISMSKLLKCTHIFCTTNHPGLIKRLEDQGMTMTSENCKHFWGGI